MPKNKSILDQDTALGEATPFQMLLGIILILVLCLACFLLGVVVGQRNASTGIRELAENVAGVTEDNKPQPTSESSGAPASESRQTRPAISQPAGGATATPKFAEKPSGARATTLVPPTKLDASASASSSAPSTVPAAPLPAPAAAPASSTSPATPPAPVRAAVSSSGEADSAAVAPPAKPAASVGATPDGAGTSKPAAATAGKGDYTIQMAALDTQKQADEYKKRVETNSDLRVNIVKMEDGKFHVLYGRYSDYASAVKARDELRKRKGFSSAWVKQLKG